MKREARPRCPFCHYSMVAAYIQRGAQISGGKHRIAKVGWYCPKDQEIFTLRDFDRGRYVGRMCEAPGEPDRGQVAYGDNETRDSFRGAATAARAAQNPQMKPREEPPMGRMLESEADRVSEAEEMPSVTNKRGTFIIYDGSDDEEALMEKYRLKELEAKVVPMFMKGIPFDEMGKRIKKSSDWAQHFVANARKKMEKNGVTLPVRYEGAGRRKEEP